jgi:hypothetical protein
MLLLNWSSFEESRMLPVLELRIFETSSASITTVQLVTDFNCKAILFDPESQENRQRSR